MKTLLFALMLAAPTPAILLPVAVTGVNGEDLADTPTTDVINMEEGTLTNQLSLHLQVTPGTSLVTTVKCFESATNTTGSWGEISVCESAASAACEPDVRTYTLADYTGTTKGIASRWPVTKKFVYCSIDDPDDGNGTVVVTGARSWQ